ncbi:MAG: hypothetical protein QNK20_01070 [Aureibaculum sp.]|nr:hypothetical protein [Aureibaculum sp.]
MKKAIRVSSQVSYETTRDIKGVQIKLWEVFPAMKRSQVNKGQY